MQEELKIPKERVAVLIGEKGSTKRQIQKLTKTKIKVNSKEGDVLIDGEDSYFVFITNNIIKAIGRGFNPKYALELIQDDVFLEVINIQDFSGNSKSNEERIKARIIGTNGKARMYIEKITDTKICIYGKTVSIIGKTENTFLAKKAVEKILNGSPHNNAYRLISDYKKKHKGEI